MFQVMLVDDDARTLRELARLVELEIPGVEVTTASDICGAMKLVEAMLQTSREFDAVVLDLMLPLSKGLNPEVDESICREVVTHMRPLVIHTTAFPENDEIQRHFHQVHLRRLGPPSIEVSKLDIDWGRHVVGQLREYLFGEHIERQLRQLFAGENGGPFGPSGVAEDSGLTYRIARLKQDIERYWKDLGEYHRQRVLQYWDVREGDGKIEAVIGGVKNAAK